MQWQKPAVGFWKCNIDGSFFDYQNKTGVGMIIRDDQGHLMVARTTWREQCMQVYEGEAWSLLETLKYAANKEPSCHFRK